MSCENHKIRVGDDTFEFRNVDAAQLPILERHFKGLTQTDETIAAMEIPVSPKWLFVVIHVLRWYRRRISPMLGNRCVFEPSCSHYSELVFRDHGFIKGMRMTAHRLYRCRPNQGGIDLPQNER